MKTHTHTKMPFPRWTTPYRFIWNGKVYEYGTSNKHGVECEDGFYHPYNEVILLTNTGKRDCKDNEIYVGDVFQRETGEYAVVKLGYSQYWVVTIKPNQKQIDEKDTDQLLHDFLKKYKKAEVIGNAWKLGILNPKE